MSTKLKYTILILSFGAFSYLVWDFGMARILDNLARTGWWFAPIVALWGCVYLFNALAWYIILRDHTSEVGMGTVYRLTVSGFAINYVTPFLNLGGEPYRVLSLRPLVGMHRAVSSVILYNMVRMMSHFYFWIGSIVVALLVLPFSLTLATALAVIFVFILSLVVFFYSRHRKGIFLSLMALTARIRFLHPLAGRLERNRAPLLEIDAQIKQLYGDHRDSFYKALVCEFIARLIASFEFYFILLAIGSTLSPVYAFLINAGSSLVLNLLFFVPFELGTREGGLYVIMQGIGITSGIGIYMGLVNRIREFVWILIGFALALPNGRTADGRTMLDIMQADERP